MSAKIKARELRKKNSEDLLAELKKLREELQSIRFTKVSGTAVAKLSKIKQLRRSIARCLGVINDNSRTNVIDNLRKRTTTDSEGKQVDSLIKNLKTKHLPLNLRPKKTRAIRRRLTKFQSKLKNVRVLKRNLNFPLRRFAVPSQ